MRTLLIASRSQWQIALSQLDDWLESNKLDAALQQKILITFDEVISNIFNHNEQKNTIEIKVAIDKNHSVISLAFTDNCKLFNPLNKEEKEEVNFGGWGIDIVRKLMDKVEYDIVAGKNCLIVKIYIS